MSRSNPTEDRLKNPAVKFFEWSGSEGTLKWYDKETKENYLVTLPFTFLVLDQLNTVSGYDKNIGGFYATEVRNAKDPITVFANKKPIQTGEWKTELKLINGTKFTKSIYIAFYDDQKQMQIGNIKFSGSALSGLSDKTVEQNLKDYRANPQENELFSETFLSNVGWFNFCDGWKGQIEEIGVQIIGKVWDKNGTSVFYRPVFKANTKVTPETNEKALQLDRELQTYLTAYLAQNKQPEQAQAASATGNNSYINQRNAELDDYEKSTDTKFDDSNGLPPVEDDDQSIPF